MSFPGRSQNNEITIILLCIVRAENVCTDIVMASLPETDVEKDHRDVGLMILNDMS